MTTDEAPELERVRVCLVCIGLDGRHTTTCPVTRLDGHLKELASSLGMYVASFRETIEALETELAALAGERKR